MSNEEFTEQPLSKKVKVVQGGSSASIYLLMSLSMNPITYYYNIILKLDAGLIAIVWLIFAVWNAANDPLFAVFQEKFISKKYGRRIPYIRFGAPFLALFFILLWMPFLLIDTSNEIALFVHLLVILLAFDTIYTFMSSANFALSYEIAFTKKERANLSIYGNLFNAIATGIVMAAPLIFLRGQDGNANPMLYPALFIISMITTTVIITASFVVKEKPYLKFEETLGLKDGIVLCFKNRPWLIASFVSFFTTITNTILLTGLLYYISIILQPTVPLLIVALLGIFASFIVFIGLLNKMLDKYGLKYTFMICIGIGIIGFFSIFFIGWDIFPGWNIYFSFIPLILVAVGYGSLSIVNPTVNGETIDYDENKTGKRREVTYGGIGALITKPAISIANALFLFMIEIFGFDPDARGGQSFEAELGLMISFALIPGISLVIAAILMYFWPLHGPEWDKVKEELKLIHLEKEKVFFQELKKKEVNLDGGT